jgi:hypothetical protein
MRILQILEVDEDVYSVTFEDEFASVSVIIFHGKDAFDNFILEGLTNGSGEHTLQHEAGRTANGSNHSFLRH